MPELSIIVPVYNEEKTLVSVMQELSTALPDAEIIYVDDGSNDASLMLLKQYARKNDVVLTKENEGKGSAVRMGLEKAQGTYCTIQDADLEYDPKEIRELLRTAKEKQCDVVYGSRFKKRNPNIYKLFLLGNKSLTLALNILFFSRLTDSYTCYKLLKTDLFRSLNLKAHGFEMEAEISAKCLCAGNRIVEVPISYKPRTIEEGKKIRFRDAIKGLMMMLKIRIGL